MIDIVKALVKKSMTLPALRLLLTALLMTAACQSQPASTVTVALIADGSTQTFAYPAPITVAELLAQAQITLSGKDRISHPLTAPIADGMQVTVRRVSEGQECQPESIPFERRTVLNENVPAGQQQVAQPGQTGLQQVCYQVVFEDGIQTQRRPAGQTAILRPPVDEIVHIGPAATAAPLPLAGRLSYISSRSIWTIQGSTTQKRPLTTRGELDSFVFHQNAAGTHILYTAASAPGDDFFNALWMTAADGSSAPLRLPPSDVLYAEWQPQTAASIAYSTGESRPAQPPWRALNNLWLMDIDLRSGQALSIAELLPESSGWATSFRWSPQGDRIAWSMPAAIGIVDLDARALVPLLNYAAVPTAPAWLWLSPLSWSHDSRFIASTAPSTPPDSSSPVFNLAVTSADGRFSVALKTAVGMWAAPRYSPDGQQIAYLQARQPADSIGSEYDLVLADRDGSNQHIVFPAAQPGTQTSGFGLSPHDFAWSPDSRSIAIIHQGDLWLLDTASAARHQITFDGGASHPVWTR